MNKKYIILCLFLCIVTLLRTMDTPSQFKIYGREGEGSAFYVPAEILQLSPTLAGMIDDLDGTTEQAIPFNNFSTEVLKLLAELLKKYNELDHSLEQVIRVASAYPLPQLVEVINCANYLGINDSLLRVLNAIVVEKVEGDYKFNPADWQALKKCDPDFVKHFIMPELVPHIVSQIKVRSLKKDEFDKKWFIENLPTGATTSASCGIFMNDDKWIALDSVNSALENRQVNIYDTVDRSLVHTLDCDVRCNQLIAHKNKYVVACEDAYMNRGVRIWNIADLNNVYTYDYHHPQGRSVETMGFSPDGNYLVLVCDGIRDNIVIIDMNTIDWNAQQPMLDTDTVVFLTEQVGHKEDKMFFMPHTSTCVIATPHVGNMRFVTVNYQTKEMSYTFEQRKIGTIRSVLNFSKDGNGLISLNHVLPDEKKIEIFDMSAMKLIKTFNGPHEAMVSITFSPDNQWAVCMKDKGKFCIYDTKKGSLLAEIEGIQEQKSLRFSNDGSQLLLAGSDPGMPHGFSGLLWTILTDEESRLLQGLYDCTIDQIIVVHRLCSQLASKGAAYLIPDSPEMKIFNSLSPEMQDFLTRMGVKIRQTWSEWLINELPKYMQIKQ